MHVVTYHFPSSLQLGGAAGFEDQLYSFCIPCECSFHQHGPALQVQNGRYMSSLGCTQSWMATRTSKTVHIYMVHAACRMHGA